MSSKLRAGDQVVVIAGKDKGKKGTIRKVYPDQGRVVVEGVNVVKKHVKASATSPQGGVQSEERAIPISKVMIADPKTGKPTRIKLQRNKSGEVVRIAKGSGSEIAVPSYSKKTRNTEAAAVTKTS